jgi:hypothetical protein
VEFAEYCNIQMASGETQSIVIGSDGNYYKCIKGHVSSQYTAPPFSLNLVPNMTEDTSPSGEIETIVGIDTTKTDTDGWKVFNDEADIWSVPYSKASIKYTFQEAVSLTGINVKIGTGYVSSSPTVCMVYGIPSLPHAPKVLLMVQNNIVFSSGEEKYWDVDPLTLPLRFKAFEIIIQNVATSISVDFIKLRGVNFNTIYTNYWEKTTEPSTIAWASNLRYHAGTENKFEFDGGFEAQTSVWDAVIAICQQARAIPIYIGNKIRIIIDKETSSTQMFSMGNITKGSFSGQFIPLVNRASELEISFRDQNDDFENNAFSVIDNTINTNAQPTSVSFPGLTRASEAWRHVKYQLALNKHIKHAATLGVSLDAIYSSLYQVIDVQHDLPEWGITGGRIVTATINTVTLDREITIEAGKVYAVMVRLFDDSMVSKNIVAMDPGVYSTIQISIPFETIPHDFDPYAFGEIENITEKFRIVGYTKTPENKITLNLTNYAPAIYTADGGTPVIPEKISYEKPKPDVVIVGIYLTEQHGLVGDTIVRSILVNFGIMASSQQVFKHAEIYYRKTGDSTWTYYGQTQQMNMTITPVEPSTAYDVAVVGVSLLNVKSIISSSCIQQITTSSEVNTEYNALTSQVHNLEILGAGDTTSFNTMDITFAWSQVNVSSDNSGDSAEDSGYGQTKPSWLLDYQITIFKTDETLLRREYTNELKYTYSFDKNTLDNDGDPVASFKIEVRARDRFGNVSILPANLTVSNTIPEPVENLDATQTVGGVQFSWDKCIEPDFLCYKYQIKVGSSAFGPLIRLADNKVSYHLTADEITLYTNKALVTICVYVEDIYGQVSTIKTISEIASQVSDNIFQLIASTDDVSGVLSTLYDGNYTSGGVTII